MHFLIEAGELLSSSLDYRSTLRNVCEAAVETIADICILDIGSTKDVEMVGAAHRDPKEKEKIRDLGRHLISADGRPAHPACRVIDSGQAFFVPNIDNAWIDANAANEEHAEFMRRMRYRSLIIVPVRSQIWGVTGALTLVRTDRSQNRYDEDAISFATDLGRRCGVAIGKARLHSQTVDIAERLQRAALPQQLPFVPELRFDVLYEPADAALLVGGDWYDVFELKDGNIGISIGDVSGHGIESAAQMSSIRNAIRMAMVMERDLGKVLVDADFLFRNEVTGTTFCTALVAVIDPRTGKMIVSSAGHPAPLVWQSGSADIVSLSPALPLGFGDLSAAKPTTVVVELEPGATAVFYTDGLVEAEHRPIHGQERLIAALSDPSIRNSSAPARAIRNACVLGSHSDDIAVLVARFIG